MSALAWILIAIAVLIVVMAVVAVLAQLPEIKRYMKIKSM